MMRSRVEDAGYLWLREHDPYYTNKKAYKKARSVKYPYETPEMEKRRNSMEIPISNLSGSQKVQFKEYAGSYTEGGDFNL